MKFSLTFKKYYKTKANAVRALQRRAFMVDIFDTKVVGYRSIYIVQFTQTRKGWKGTAL